MTGNEPFTSKLLDDGQRRELARNLHRLMIRAQSRVRPADRAAFNQACKDAELDIEAQINFMDEPSAMKTLEKMLALFRKVTPYLMQPDSSVRNQPFPGDKQATLGVMVQEARAVFDAIAAGHADAQLVTTFGTNDNAELTKIRKIYSATSAALDGLYQKGRIFADSRGDLTVQGAAALTGPDSMLLPVDFADARTEVRVRTLLHESFHATTTSIIDHLYESDPSFPTLDLARKLTNADTFARVARIHAHLQPAPPPEVDVSDPPGITLTPAEQDKAREALATASHRAHRAWVRALWDRQFMDRIGFYSDTSNAADIILRRLSRTSELCGMTLHAAAARDSRPIAPQLKIGRSEAVHPNVMPFPVITAFDCAVLEEVVSDLHSLVGWMHHQPTVWIVGDDVPPQGVAWLYAASVRNPGIQASALATELLDRAAMSLPKPWLSSGTLRQVVEALRIQDTSSNSNQ